MTINFPRLDAVEAELKQIFAEAGEDCDLANVKSLAGMPNIDRLKYVRTLNDERDELVKTLAAAEKHAPGSRESGAEQGWTGGAPRKDLSKVDRLTKTDSFADWTKARGLSEGTLERDVTPEMAWHGWFKGYVTGNWSEFRQMTKQMATDPGGSGGFLVPAPLSGSVIDRLRSSAPLFVMGATTVPMTSKTLDIARIATDVDATAWHLENAVITPTQPALDKVTFTAKTLPVLVKASRELAEDAPNTGAVVAQSIAGATAVELTRAALRGDGAAGSPTGIANNVGIGTTAVAGAADWSTILNAVSAIAGRDAIPNGYITAPRTAGALEGQTGTDGHFVMPPPTVAGLNRTTTTAIPVNLGVGSDTEAYVADWTKLLIGMRSEMTIEPLRERFADDGQVAFLAWMRVDVQLEHAAAFHYLTGITN